MDTVKSHGEPNTSRARGEPSTNGSGEHLLRDSSSSNALNQNFKVICTWCNNEFFREPIDAQTQAEVVGFICTSCKDKISGPLNRATRNRKGAVEKPCGKQNISNWECKHDTGRQLCGRWRG